MFARLTQDNKPIYVNLNLVSSFRPIDGERYHTEILINGSSIYVNEPVGEIVKLIQVKKFPVETKVAENKMPLSTSVEELDFTMRAYHVLARYGVANLGDIIKLMTFNNVKLMRGMGEVTMKEITGKVHSCGYKFDWED